MKAVWLAFFFALAVALASMAAGTPSSSPVSVVSAGAEEEEVDDNSDISEQELHALLEAEADADADEDVEEQEDEQEVEEEVVDEEEEEEAEAGDDAAAEVDEDEADTTEVDEDATEAVEEDEEGEEEEEEADGEMDMSGYARFLRVWSEITTDSDAMAAVARGAAEAGVTVSSTDVAKRAAAAVAVAADTTAAVAGAVEQQAAATTTTATAATTATTATAAGTAETTDHLDQSTRRAVHRALTAQAARKFSAASRWFSWMAQGVAHDKLSEQALELVKELDPNADVARHFNLAALEKGIKWIDMPSGSDEHPSSEPLDLETFHREYDYHGQHTHLVHNVHFGCLQHWHSQCPAIQRSDLADEFGDDRLVLTNKEVKDLIMKQIKRWWEAAVDAKDRPVASSFLLGHILHTVQDSWTRSHVLRGTENTPSLSRSDLDPDNKGDTMAESCGNIYYFQGADAQEGNSKKPLEKATDGAAFYFCAHYYSYIVLRIFGNCAGATAGGDTTMASKWCTFDTALKQVLDESVYPLAIGHEDAVAGGSVLDFASPRIERLGYQSTNYAVEGVGPTPVWEPTSRKFWTKLGGNDLETSLCERVVSQVMNNNGITARNEVFSDFHNEAYGSKKLRKITCYFLEPHHQRKGPFWVKSDSGMCETHGFRLSAACSTHRSCRPAPSGCDGVCRCGARGKCSCIKRFDNAEHQCNGRSHLLR